MISGPATLLDLAVVHAGVVVEEHEATWKLFAETKPENLSMDDIPWPDAPDGPPELRFALMAKQLRADDLEGTVLKMLRKRWHPDKFMNSKFGRNLQKEYDAVKARIDEVSAYVNFDVETQGRWRSKPS
jgi:hypothetical protein